MLIFVSRVRIEVTLSTLRFSFKVDISSQIVTLSVSLYCSINNMQDQPYLQPFVSSQLFFFAVSLKRWLVLMLPKQQSSFSSSCTSNTSSKTWDISAEMPIMSTLNYLKYDIVTWMQPIKDKANTDPAIFFSRCFWFPFSLFLFFSLSDVRLDMERVNGITMVTFHCLLSVTASPFHGKTITKPFFSVITCSFGRAVWCYDTCSCHSWCLAYASLS